MLLFMPRNDRNDEARTLFTFSLLLPTSYLPLLLASCCFRLPKKRPRIFSDAGAQWLTRYHPDSRAFGRAFIPACIGTARRGLNVLAPACSGAMFPGLPDAAFHLPRLSWDGPNRVLSPSSHVLPYLTDSWRNCQGKFRRSPGQSYKAGGNRSLEPKERFPPDPFPRKAIEGWIKQSLSVVRYIYKTIRFCFIRIS